MTTLRLSAITTFLAHGLPETPHLIVHFLCPHAAEAENEALADIRAHVSGRQRPQPKTFPRGARRNLLVGQSWRKRNDQMHAGFRAQDLYLGAELVAERSRERIAPIRVQLPGLPDVPREMTSSNEVRE